MKILPLALLCGALAMAANAATLIHYYPFTVDASDTAGTDHGTLSGDATVSGGVLNLDGSGDFVDFVTHLIPGAGSFSVLVSSKVSFAGPYGGIMEMISQGGSGTAFYIGNSPSGVRVGDNWGSAFGTFPIDGGWHTYAVTVGAASTTLYIDGAFASLLGSAISNAPGGTDTRFGRQYNGHAEYFNGQLDDIRIYTGELTAGEVALLNGGGGSEVPEPLTLALTGAGLIVVGLGRKLRAKHHHGG